MSAEREWGWLDELGKPRSPKRRDEPSRRVAHIVEHRAQTLTSWSEARTREFGEDIAHALFDAGLILGAGIADTETPR